MLPVGFNAVLKEISYILNLLIDDSKSMRKRRVAACFDFPQSLQFGIYSPDNLGFVVKIV